MSKCPSQDCRATSFEAVEAKIKNTRFPYLFVQCSSCKTVVGVVEAHYSSETVNNLSKKLTGKSV